MTARPVQENLFAHPGAERALLGLILERRGGGLADVAALTLDDFSDLRNREILRAMRAVGAPLDLVIVHDQLVRSRVEVSLSYLVQLVDEAGAAPERLAEILQRCTRRRRYDSFAKVLRAIVWDAGVADLDGEVGRLAREILALVSGDAPA